MLQLLAALALVLGLTLGHIHPMDNPGGPPVPKATPSMTAFDNPGGPPVP